VKDSGIAWPDRHILNATEGWLELGQIPAAREEFARLSAAARALPPALGIEWQLLAAEKQWAAAVGVAEALLRTAPEAPEAWIHRSFALHELRDTARARDLLTPAAKLFPREPTIPYNLACYECQLGNLEAARRWLRRAVRRQTSRAARQQQLTHALADPDLAPLAEEIRQGRFAP
jgi:Flp pilus assembly protein TadD